MTGTFPGAGASKGVKREYEEEEESLEKEPEAHKRPRKSRAKAAASASADPSSASSSTPAEKRLARFKAKCPKNIAERIERVRQQRFYLIARERAGTALEEAFKVLGSTGNVYTVTIRNLPTCDCPDAAKGNHCKHLIFVLVKVLGVLWTSSLVYQKALLTSELQEIFDNAPAAPHAVQHSVLAKAWERVTGSPSKESKPQSVPDTVPEECEVAPTGKRLMPEEDDSCPVCYENIYGEDVNKFTFCTESCGKPIHRECMTTWATAMRAKGDAVTCVWCRAPWVGPENKTNAGGFAGPSQLAPDAAAEFEEGYMNLAGVMGIERSRDVSSYYCGPRAGMNMAAARATAFVQYGGSSRGFPAPPRRRGDRYRDEYDEEEYF